MKLIVGSNSQIGKSLLCNFINRENVYVMSSNHLKLVNFIKELDNKKRVQVLRFNPFLKNLVLPQT